VQLAESILIIAVKDKERSRSYKEDVVSFARLRATIKYNIKVQSNNKIEIVKSSNKA
jgi:hypothetical protein